MQSDRKKFGFYLTRAGVRLIDTASAYENEREVGKAVRESGIPRKKIFVTTKLYPDQYDNPEKAINDSLKRLNIDYIDLLLLHHPRENDVKAYKAMEKAVKQGKSVPLDCPTGILRSCRNFYRR